MGAALSSIHCHTCLVNSFLGYVLNDGCPWFCLIAFIRDFLWFQTGAYGFIAFVAVLLVESLFLRVPLVQARSRGHP